jgi:hypothetical protein
VSRDRRPSPFEALVRAAVGRPDDDDQRASTFARGLALGALVGAAIAGSTIWQRRNARVRGRAVTGGPAPRAVAAAEAGASREPPREGGHDRA